MKKLLHLLLLTPIIYLTSCSSSPDLSPTTTSLHGIWQYDSWLLDGDELLNDYVSYLNICEDSGYWATQIFDIEGNMTSNSQAGSFTVNDDQTEGVFTAELVYEAINGWLILDLPQTFSVSIYKLDDNELDFSFQYAGHTEIIESVKTPTEPTCSYTLVAAVSGCTDSLATNYNPLATIDDGSCEYGIQEVYVNILVDLSLPEYSDLQVSGNSIFITGGVKGIIIYHGVGNNYKVYDRNCSYEPSLACSYIDSVNSGIAYCGCCTSAFLLAQDGAAANSPALLPLKEYYWTLSGSQMRISN